MNDWQLSDTTEEFRREERHAYNRPVNADLFFGDDPDLALVHADMHAWAEAHPCDCEALCECDKENQ